MRGLRSAIARSLCGGRGRWLQRQNGVNTLRPPREFLVGKYFAAESREKNGRADYTQKMPWPGNVTIKRNRSFHLGPSFALLFLRGASRQARQHLANVAKSRAVLERLLESSAGRGRIPSYAFHLCEVLCQPGNIFIAFECRAPKRDRSLQVS